MWLTGRLIPDHKTIANFRKDSGPAIKWVCVQFIELCRQMGLLTKASVAIDGRSDEASRFRVAVLDKDGNAVMEKIPRAWPRCAADVARAG
jgi:hypothetical protein